MQVNPRVESAWLQSLILNYANTAFKRCFQLSCAPAERWPVKRCRQGLILTSILFPAGNFNPVSAFEKEALKAFI